MSTIEKRRTETDASNEGIETLHAAWVKNRDAALAETFTGFTKDVADWYTQAAAAKTDAEGINVGMLVGLGTTVADCADAHGLATDGYFRLAHAMEVDGNPSGAARIWYMRSLTHAELAGLDFDTARATFCLGILDDAEGSPDAAREYFLKARNHADRAGNPGGKAAALYRLSLQAMAQSDLKVAWDYAIESYLVSRQAGQTLPAIETCTALFKFLARLGVDSLAESLAIDLLSLFIESLAQGDDDTARTLGALSLRAIAPLNKATRDAILRGFGERYGDEPAQSIRAQLDAVVAMQDSKG